METQKHYIDANGNHFVATFNTEALASSYTPPSGAVSVSARPSTDHVWQDGAWVYVEPAAPTVDQRYPPLEPWRFWAIINMPDSIGEANLRGAINAHSDPVFKAIATARLNNPPGGLFVRSDSMFSNADLMTALSITTEIVNDLWDAGHAIVLPS